MDIGTRIKEKRKEKGLTLEQLGAAAGIGKTTIMRYETGDISNIPSDRIEKIAEALGTTPAYLMGWDEQTPEQIQDALFTERQILFDKSKKCTAEQLKQLQALVDAMIGE